MAPYIRKVLDLSTAHLPERYGQTLSGVDGVVAHAYEYGWLLWVPNDPTESSEAMDDEVPPEILKIQLYARGLDCDYVLLDRDGDIDDNLPTWKW